MSERPIIFSTEMVRAILEGRKNQTRRVIKVPWYYGKRVQPFDPYYVEEDGKLLYQDAYGDFHPMEEICPYGQPGEILWVRETWAYEPPTYCYEASVSIPVQSGHYIYRADYQQPDLDLVKWRPSIHMPREAARIFLRVKNVRAERLQDITEEDAKAEGADKVHYCIHPIDGVVPYKDECYGTYREGFQMLWDSIYAKRGYGWDTNPWVWGVEFERAEGPIGRIKAVGI